MSNDQLQKHTLHLRAGDMDFIKSITPEGKASEMIRKIVSRFVDATRKKETDLPPMSLTDLDL